MRILLSFGLLLYCVSVNASIWEPVQLMRYSAGVCKAWEKTGEFSPGILKGSVETSGIEVRGRRFGLKHRLAIDDQSYLEVDVMGPTGRPSRFIITLYRSGANPLMMLQLSSDCSLQRTRKINYSDTGQALNIVSLDKDFAETGPVEWLNPPLNTIETGIPGRPDAQDDQQPRPVRVAMVDSGVNYNLPLINARLARDSANRLVGYDFWDMDDLPFDAHQARSQFLVQRHGTRTASLLLLEAPFVELVPYRYPRPDMSRMARLVEHAARNQVAIVGMPLGSNKKQDWMDFERAAAAHPNILFIASAGNNGRNIDDDPVYPAALDLDNMLVVTSADDFVKPAQRTNWGKKSVDFLVPAENLNVTGYSGEQTRASGSSYAVSRLAALAARIQQAHPGWSAANIIAELKKRYRDELVLDWVSSGYIADPLAHPAVSFETLPELAIGQAQTRPGPKLALDILVLDPEWTRERIEQTVKSAFDNLEQCGITAGKVAMRAFSGPDYLRDLSTGGAHTLLSGMDSHAARVIFARDTRMQDAFSGEAFGEGNTRSRPWLTNSVWLMLDIRDEGLALAHELFHVISNTGSHVDTPGNLMQADTHADNRSLTDVQCRYAITNGLSSGLLAGQ